MEPRDSSKHKPIDFNLRTKKIISLEWNAGGNHLAFYSTDNDIKVWNYEDIDISRGYDLKGHSKRVGQISWKPEDDNILASVGHDCTLKLWDLRSDSVKGGGALKSIHNEKTKNPNYVLNWNPSGEIIAVGNDKEQVDIYDLRTWKIIQNLDFQEKKCELNQIEWDRTGNMLFIPNTTGTVYVLDGKNPELDAMEEINAHFGTVFCIRISHNNELLATGSADSHLCVWDIDELACLRSVTKKDSIIDQVSFSQDDKYIAASCRDEVRKESNIDIYNTNTGERECCLAFAAKKFTVAWHPKVNVLAFGGEGEKEGCISLLPFNEKV